MTLKFLPSRITFLIVGLRNYPANRIRNHVTQNAVRSFTLLTNRRTERFGICASQQARSFTRSQVCRTGREEGSGGGMTCWKCSSFFSSQINFPIKCPKCNSLQDDPSPPNYFEILGLKTINYELDLREISGAVKILQRQLHPDLFTLRDKKERDLSYKLSSLVNKAFATLADPIQRGQYILTLKGIEVNLEKEQMLDPRFLGEVMELNEVQAALENAEQWKEFRQQNEQKLLSLEKELGESFRKDDLTLAQLVLNKMKFYESLQSRLKQVQFKFGVVD